MAKESKAKIIPFYRARTIPETENVERDFIQYKNVQLYEGYTDRNGEEITACIEVCIGDMWVEDLVLSPGYNNLRSVSDMITTGEMDEILGNKSYVLHAVETG